MPKTIRVRIDLQIFDALVRLADQLPGDTPAERGAHLAAAVEAYRESIRSGREYRPLGDVVNDSPN